MDLFSSVLHNLNSLLLSHCSPCPLWRGLCCLLQPCFVSPLGKGSISKVPLTISNVSTLVFICCSNGTLKFLLSKDKFLQSLSNLWVSAQVSIHQIFPVCQRSIGAVLPTPTYSAAITEACLHFSGCTGGTESHNSQRCNFIYEWMPN